MATKVQIRRGTAAQWTAKNPVLAQGEPGLETDTGLRKTGDGSTAWASLPYDGARLPLPEAQGGSGAATLGEGTVTATGSTTARAIRDWMADTGAVPGLVADSTAAAAANTTKIRAALDRGGLVYIGPAGSASPTVYISSSLQIGDHTQFRVAPNVTIRLVDGSNTNMLVTKSYTATQTAITITWAAGTTASVAWTGHPFAVGDYCAIKGANQSAYVGVFLVATITDADNFVVVLTETPTAAPSGTITAVKAVVDIEFGGGTWDHGSNGGTPQAMLSLLFGYVQGLTIHPTRYKNQPKMCVTVGAVRDFYIRGQHAINGAEAGPGVSDVVKTYGPAFNGTIEGISGVTGDDGTSIQPVEPAAFIAYDFTGGGSIVGVTVRNVGADNQGTTAVALYLPTGGTPWRMDQILVDGVFGRSKSGVPRVKIEGDSTAGDYNSKAQRIEIRRVHPAGSNTAGATGYEVRMSRYCYVESLTLDSLTFDDPGYATTNPPISFAGKIDTLAVSNVLSKGTSSVVALDVTSVMQTISARDVRLTNTGVISGAIISVGGTVRSLAVRDSSMANANDVVVASSGTIGTLTLENIRAETPRDLVYLTGSTVETINVRGCSVATRFAATAAAVNAGGAGYAVDDTITLAGGTFYTAIILKVTGVAGGAVTSVSVQEVGAYRGAPANPVAQGSTSGGGAGANFNVTWTTTTAPRFVKSYTADSTVGVINVVGNTADSGVHSFVDTSGRTIGNAQINMEGNRSDAVVGIAANYSCRANARNNTFTAVSSGMFRVTDAGGTQTFVLTGSGNSLTGGNALVKVNGAEKVSVYSPDMKVALDSLQRTAGSMAVALAGVGTIAANELAVCDSTGAANSWKQVTDTTKVY